MKEVSLSAYTLEKESIGHNESLVLRGVDPKTGEAIAVKIYWLRNPTKHDSVNYETVSYYTKVTNDAARKFRSIKVAGFPLHKECNFAWSVNPILGIGRCQDPYIRSAIVPFTISKLIPGKTLADIFQVGEASNAVSTQKF